ncbi:Tol-Pal system protein TolB [Nymphon striatum]|nr:Tol-Pal system protein TolB [Nymphon striatum]
MIKTLLKHPGAVLGAVLFHLFIIALFVLSFDWTEKPKVAEAGIPVQLVQSDQIEPMAETESVKQEDKSDPVPQKLANIDKKNNEKKKQKELEQKRLQEQQQLKEKLRQQELEATAKAAAALKLKQDLQKQAERKQLQEKKLAEEKQEEERLEAIKLQEAEEEQKKEELKKAEAQETKKKQEVEEKREKEEAETKRQEKLAAEKTEKRRKEKLLEKKKAEKAAKKKAEEKARKRAEKKAKEKARKKAEKKKAEKEAKKKLAKEKALEEKKRKEKAEKKAAEERAKEKAREEAIAKAKVEKAAAAARAAREEAAKKKVEEEKRKEKEAAEALAAKKAEYHRKWKEAQEKKKSEAAAAAKKAADAKVAAARAKSNAQAKNGALQSWGGKVLSHVKRRWHKPPDSQGNKAKVRITVSGSGFIAGGIQVKSCNGTPAFCASVKEAFQKSEPLPRPPSKYNFIRQFVVGLLVLLFVQPAFAELELHISKDTDNGIPIVVMPISGGASGIIEADLKRSGRFNIVNHSQITGLSPFGGSVQAGKYQAITDYIVRGKATANGTLDIEFISTSDNAVTHYTISANSNSRRIAHKAADKIYQKVTRIKGAFDTRLAYVTVTNKTSENRTFRLYVSDSDGHSPQTVLTSRLPIISPSWSPNGQELAYVSFEEETSAIYVQNIYSGEKRLISARDGLNGAPSWSPDGQFLAMSLSISGNPEIYTVNTLTGHLKRVTNSSAIDTEPTWNGKSSIVFTSNRGGSPQIYQIPASGGKAKRMTFEGGYNSGAEVANNKMAYITGRKGAFHVAMKSVNGSDRQMLSNGRLDESPTISPNGAMVAYTTHRGGQSTLAVVSDNAKARQFLTSPAGDVREPTWSPFLR